MATFDHFIGVATEIVLGLTQCEDTISEQCSSRGHFTGFPHLLENLEKYSTPGKPGKNHEILQKIMEFCQSGNVGTLGYCGK